MITLYEKSLLDEILKWDDVEEAIDYLMSEYGKKDVYNVMHLIGQIGDLASTALEQKQKIANKYAEAAHWLMAQREMEPDKSGQFFASMLPVCQIMFPNGNAEGHTKTEKRYFQMFLDAFSDKKQFSWERDRVWADHFNYTAYLQLVERQMGGGK